MAVELWTCSAPSEASLLGLVAQDYHDGNNSKTQLLDRDRECCAGNSSSGHANSVQLISISSSLRPLFSTRPPRQKGRLTRGASIGQDSSPNSSFAYKEADNAMPWGPWSSRDDKEDKKPVRWTDTLNATDWSHYTDPRNVVPVVLLTATCLGSYTFYRSYLRRIPQATLVRPGFWRKRSLFGQVTSVGDGDNFRLFHTPGGRLAGWGWMPGRKVPEKRKELKDKTVCGN